MSAIRLGIIMNGVTGRMGRNQHLERSIIAIRDQGGVRLADGGTVVPEPILVGRDKRRLKELAGSFGLESWSTDVDACLEDDDYPVYFDAQVTSRRAEAVRAALEAGKHVYCEKPLAEDFHTALELARLARHRGLKNGIVQDKLFLPGLLRLQRLVDDGFFGRILSVKADFGYWVFEGHRQPPQRPSWNYRSEDGGGIILDMFPHWQYVIEGLFGRIERLTCLGATHIDERIDDAGNSYAATADDAAYATFRLEGGAIVQMNSSWTTRVHRDELFQMQVDGIEGSAVAGLRHCVFQRATDTPRAIWNPDIEDPIDHLGAWTPVEGSGGEDNGFKLQWQRFIAHVADEGSFPWTFLAAARGLQLVDLAMRSWAESCWVEVPEVGL
jgi:predicted dehydrogenase